MQRRFLENVTYSIFNKHFSCSFIFTCTHLVVYISRRECLARARRAEECLLLYLQCKLQYKVDTRRALSGISETNEQTNKKRDVRIMIVARIAPRAKFPIYSQSSHTMCLSHIQHVTTQPTFPRIRYMRWAYFFIPAAASVARCLSRSIRMYLHTLGLVQISLAPTRRAQTHLSPLSSPASSCRLEFRRHIRENSIRHSASIAHRNVISLPVT